MGRKESNKTNKQKLLNIYILIVAARISRCKTLNNHMILTAPPHGIISTSANDFLSFLCFALTLCTHVLLLAVPSPLNANKIIHFIRIISGIGWKKIKYVFDL